jgi:hypothetical protein
LPPFREPFLPEGDVLRADLDTLLQEICAIERLISPR